MSCLTLVNIHLILVKLGMLLPNFAECFNIRVLPRFDEFMCRDFLISWDLLHRQDVARSELCDYDNHHIVFMLCAVVTLRFATPFLPYSTSVL